MHSPLVYVFQIGYGKWGKIAFKKLLELSKNLKDVNVVLEGICDIDSNARSQVKEIIKREELSTKVFPNTKEMYHYASSFDRVLIFDAGPSELHAGHTLKSIEFGFFHLSEKPPYMTLKEKEMIEKMKSGKWSFDAIENRNPAVLSAIKFIKENEVKILSIKAFRYNSIGIKKLVCKDYRYGVQGGDILDKAVHEIYLLDFLNSSKVKFTDSNIDFFMIKSLERPEIHLTRGVPTSAQSNLKGMINDVEIEVHTGWLGVPNLGFIEGVEKQTGKKVKFSKEIELCGKKFRNEELRMFIIEGEKENSPIKIYGDMKHFQLFVKDARWKEIEVEKRDQLYEILKNAIYTAAGKSKFYLSPEKIKSYMDFLFAGINNALRDIDLRKEALKTKELVKNKIE